MNYCNSCGVPLPDGAHYCPQCGCPQAEKQIPMPSGDLAAKRLRQGIFFLDNLLAFVAVGVLATVTMILFAVGSQGFTVWNAPALLQQFCLVGALSVSALVSTRTGGLDLSVGGMMALSSLIFAMNATSMGGAWLGFLMALVICGSIGLLNGMLVMVARVPSIFVTIASVMLVRGIALWSSEGIEVQLPSELTGAGTLAALIALLVSVSIAALLLWRTGRFSKSAPSMLGARKWFWIYGLTAVIGVLAGCAAALCSGLASVSIGSGSSNEMILLFVFATLSASALLKHNGVALGWVLLVALLWTIHDQAMILLALNPFSMIVSNASWVFILMSIMAIAKRSWEKHTWVM